MIFYRTLGYYDILRNTVNAETAQNSVIFKIIYKKSV